MTGLDDRDYWLLDSAAHKILCVGDNPIEFATKLRDFRDENPGRFRRLSGICARLEFVEKLRHTLSLAVSTQNRWAALYQLDRLATYLTTTCIDIATGERYQPYHEWLQQAYESSSLGNNWNIAIKELSEAGSDLESAKLFVELTMHIYEKDYLVKTSVRQAFKGFVCNMHDWFKEWLFKEYIIEEHGDNPLNFREPKWEKLNDEEKCKRIAFYLYELRNLYTHTVIDYQPMDSVQRSVRRTDGVTGYVATVFPALSSTKGRDRTIILQAGVDESDMVRFLVVAWLRKHWLEIQDDESFVQRYWDRADYRRIGFDFYFELDDNLNLIEMWCSNHLYSHSLKRSSLSTFKLSDTAARKFIGSHEKICHAPISSSIHAYLASIERINLKIAEFNTQYDEHDWWTKAPEMDKLFAEIVRLPETRQLVSCTEAIKQYLFPTLDVSYY